MTHQSMTISAATVLLAALALAGCNKHDDVNTSGTGDSGAATAPAPTMGDKAAKTTDDAKTSVKEAANDVKDASKNAADQAGNKVADAMITTAVKAELAKDSALSALRINVDTDSGRVALKGTAPDANAKDRATKLASTVKGVVSVDNQLTVESKS